MAGRGIRIYTDEDVDAQLAVQLRRHGYDALSTTEAGNSSLGLDDDSQLRFASRLQRAILVHNLRHFVPLDAAWKERGAQHYGIIAAEQTALAALFRRVCRHLDTVSPEEQYNTLLFLAR